MNIILIPEGIRKGRTASFTQRHVAAIVVSVALILPAVLGTVSYQIFDLLKHGGHGTQLERLQSQQQQLAAQRVAIAKSRLHTGAHLNALAQRLGHLQAQVMRLNALGSRLTRMAGLDAREFDFAARPAVGGPIESSATIQHINMFGALNSLDNQVARQAE